MRVKILEGCAVRLPRGVFHGGIECDLTAEEIVGNESFLLVLKPTASPVVTTPESDLKAKLFTA